MDDPYTFGQIAAANALSDVYAMGGRPTLAMNLLCVPSCLSLATVRKILEGGHDKAVEAGCLIAGGHTIQDKKPKIQDESPLKSSYAQMKKVIQAQSFTPREFKVTKAASLDYGVGDTVRHVKFGVGVVKNIAEGGRDYEVTVDFDKAGVKKMFASFAKLKKI